MNQAKPNAQKPPRPAPGQMRRPGGDGSDAPLEENVKLLLADTRYQEGEGEQTAESSPESQAPLIMLVNCLVTEAMKRNASDIHIEPFEATLRVRFRIDGVLHEIQKLPIKLGPPILSRLKIMAELDICEKRIPQDGLIRFKSKSGEADLRLSTLPSAFGEKAVMRILGRTNLNNDLSKLQIPSAQLKKMRTAIQRPDGMVLVTGPTGSGKTTTLYAAINELNEVGVSVFTAEDPVEGTIAGVTQCCVNPIVGFTFASILRAFLRQDPDIILVGEIRDQETAEISIKAALTGHLVLSTLHTNCAASTITRLLNMGVPAYLVASATSCIVAQRLVRRICERCKKERKLDEDGILSLGLTPEALPEKTLYHGSGCPNCHNTGYKGRVAVYEVMTITDELRRAIVLEATKSELKLLARSQGMITLREAGMDLVRSGVTTLEEVLGTTNEDDEVAAPAPAPVIAPIAVAQVPIAGVAVSAQPPAAPTQVVAAPEPQPQTVPPPAAEPKEEAAPPPLPSAPAATAPAAAPQPPAPQPATEAPQPAADARPESGVLRWKMKRPGAGPG